MGLLLEQEEEEEEQGEQLLGQVEAGLEEPQTEVDLHDLLSLRCSTHRSVVKTTPGSQSSVDYFLSSPHMTTQVISDRLLVRFIERLKAVKPLTTIRSPSVF